MRSVEPSELRHKRNLEFGWGRLAQEPSFVMEFAGYVLEPLRVDSEFALYRGRQPGNAVSILILAPRHAPQMPAYVLRLEHEASFAGELDPAWAARPCGLVRHHGQTVLILEDPGGDPLIELLGQPLELTRFLHLAIGLAGAVRKAHQRGLIHKDIKPANLLVDGAGNVRLTGFGIASRLPREHQGLAAPEIIAGTLAYMAPEHWTCRLCPYERDDLVCGGGLGVGSARRTK